MKKIGLFKYKHGMAIIGVSAMFSLLMIYTSINIVRADDAGHSKEIGVPLIPSAGKGRHLDSAFMAPDGKHFYTLYEGLLTKFSISPVQKLSSSEIDFKEILSAKNFFKVFITSDEKRLIISNSKEAQIALVDISTGQIIKTIKVDTTYSKVYVPDYHREMNSRSIMIDSVLNGNEFLVIKEDEILVFDAYTLAKLKEVTFDWRATQHHSRIHNIYNKLIYIGVREVGQIKGNNYLQWSLYARSNLPRSNSCWGKSISEARITFDFNSIKNGTVEKFNICGYPVANDESFIDKRTIDLGFGPISTAGHYVVSGYRYTLENLKNGKKYKIIQYQDGEVILFDTASGKNFILTSKARKHLKMKDSAGEIVPINNSTFDKYNVRNL